MYNFCSAFLICAVLYVIGEYVCKLTKAWIPAVFVTAVLFIIGYWTVLPKTLVSDTVLIPFGCTIGIYLIITHMGTIISLKQLIEQWKTVVIVLVGLAGMVGIGWFVCPLFMDKTLVIAGLPPLTGGIVAATTMQTAAANAGLKEAAVFAIAMYCIQGFAGYPLTALCLHKESSNLLKGYRDGTIVLSDKERKEMFNVGLTVIADDSKVKKLLPRIPDEWNTPVLMLGKLALVAWIASLLGAHTPIPGVIWCLVLGIFATTIGFLETNLLNRASSYWILMFALVVYVYDGLKDCTPAMLKDLLLPMLILIVIGVFGMAVGSFIVAKITHRSFYLSFANGLTALYGFPFDALLTEQTCRLVGQDEEETAFLMSRMFPSMIVGGFTSVTITSVFLAGWFSTML